MRLYRTLHVKETRLRIACDRFQAAAAAVRRQRQALEGYLASYPAFARSLVPLPPLAEAPEIALRLHRASQAVGVGPMAAVAGAIAQMAAEAVLQAGGCEAIVENGGDLYAVSPEPVRIGLFAGAAALGHRLAFLLGPSDMPLAVCSSSGRMGHSHSAGHCDLATVVGADAALADAAATRAGNLVRSARDLQGAAETIAAIPGVRGVLLALGADVALAGRLPALVRNRDTETLAKITRDPGSVLPG